MGIWKFLKDYFTVGEGYFTVEPEPMLLKENEKKRKKKRSIWDQIVASSKELEPEQRKKDTWDHNGVSFIDDTFDPFDPSYHDD